ncbi:DUF998 domain-containing protein [Phytoactinopolyspora limicola]|uniref:DUF998 domain-containing protein n=1 Tax=Phytoactinopolyspora limicola TaxID=2715536 RepID=UPI00140CCC7B|nr:DUF998 domain-containing protein [Phytoactinopolyspora limicola]
MVAWLAEWSRRRKLFAWLAAPSIVGALVFTTGWLVAGAIQDRYDPRSDYISSLAAVDAANPWIMITAMVAFGVGVMSLGAGLFAVLEDRMGRIASFAVLLSGLGVVVVGMMRHDCGVQLPSCSVRVSMGEVSGYHAVHDVAAGLTFVLAGIAQLLISRGVRRHDAWRYLRLPSSISGVLTLVLFTLMTSDLLPEWVGVIQRTIAIVASIWVSALGVHLFRLDIRGHQLSWLARRVPAETPAPVLTSR